MYRYETWAETHLNIVQRSGSEAMCTCPIHDSTGATFQFNIEKGLWNCFSCGAGGGMKTLTKHLGLRYQDPEVDVNDLIHRLNQLKGQSDRALTLPVLAEDHLSRYKFPTTYWGPCTGDSRPPVTCSGRVGCPHHRHLTPQTIAAFDLGFDPLENAAIIPLRNINGGLIGVIRRFLDKDVDIRYRYPKGFKRGKAFYASWLVEHDDDDTAVIVEGSIDAMKVWQAGYMGLAQYGSSMTYEQIRLLLRMGIQRVVLMYDNDRAGSKATQQALGYRTHVKGGQHTTEYDQRSDLTRHFLVEYVNWDKAKVKGSDPGSLSSRQIRTLIDGATPALLT